MIWALCNYLIIITIIVEVSPRKRTRVPFCNTPTISISICIHLNHSHFVIIMFILLSYFLRYVYVSYLSHTSFSYFFYAFKSFWPSYRLTTFFYQFFLFTSSVFPSCTPLISICIFITFNITILRTILWEGEKLNLVSIYLSMFRSFIRKFRV